MFALRHHLLAAPVDDSNTGPMNAATILRSCAWAVAAGDARRVFRSFTDGLLQNAAVEKCVGVFGDKMDGGPSTFSECGGKSRGEIPGNGQS